MFFERCTDKTPPDLRNWGPCAPVTIDNLDIGAVNVTGDIQTEAPFACAFDAAGERQGWVFSVIEDRLADTGGLAVATRALGYRNNLGVATVPWVIPSGWTLGDCAAPEVGKELVLWVARLCGDQAGTATLAPLDGPDPATGSTITIPGGYRALSWNYLRQTQQDPGDGSIASVTVGNAMYAPGSGFQYQQHGWDVHSDSHDSYQDPITFTVAGEAFIEILVVTETP